jgi:hypothetical protein
MARDSEEHSVLGLLIMMQQCLLQLVHCCRLSQKPAHNNVDESIERRKNPIRFKFLNN